MIALLEITLPVFLVTGFGYVAVWRGFFSDSGVDALMRFTQGFAIPCLLYKAIATLDLGEGFDPSFLLTFYLGSTICFFAGMLCARQFFGRDWEDSVAIGFCCLFANSVLLGLPIMEQAYGAESLAPNYAIVAIHAPFCYALGITSMEIARSHGEGFAAVSKSVLSAIFKNALMIGILLGFVANVLDFQPPGVVDEALDLMIRAALPAALFGLGGILVRYRPEGEFGLIAMVCAISLLLHPAISWLLGNFAFGVGQGQLRSAVLTAAMPAGVNAYVFCSMYGRALRTAASSVLLGTLICVLTATLWLSALG